jgi:hypothetical protein
MDNLGVDKTVQALSYLNDSFSRMLAINNTSISDDDSNFLTSDDVDINATILRGDSVEDILNINIDDLFSQGVKKKSLASSKLAHIFNQGKSEYADVMQALMHDEGKGGTTDGDFKSDGDEHSTQALIPMV